MADLPPNKGDRPKRHHLVPKFYLARFAVKGNVELVRRDDLTTSFSRTIEQALTENHFYSIEVEEGLDPVVEKMLGTEVEYPAERAFHRMFDEKACPLDAPGRRGAISLFLAFQHLRGPSTRQMLVEEHKASAGKLVSMMTPEMVLRGARERGKEMTEERAIDAVEFAQQPDKYRIEIRRQANLHLGAVFPMVFDAVRFFYVRAWHVLEFDEPCLLTSDEPVALVGEDPNAPGQRVGLVSAPQIVFPIDPRHALVMIRPDFEAGDLRTRGTPQQAKIINEHVAFKGHRFIVRTPGTDPLAGMKLPEKASSVVAIGDIIGMTPHLSVEAQADMVKRIRKKHGGRAG